MTGKEKLQNALNHGDTVVPVDFGASAVTGIHCSIVEGLREYYGLEKRPVRVCEPYQMLGLIEEDLMECLGVNVVGVFPMNAMFGFPMENWKEWKTPWGQDVLVPGEFNTILKGEDIYIYPQGDMTAEPSGHMPGGGYFFDSIIRQQELVEENLDPEDNLEEYGLVSDSELEYYRDSCEAAAKTGNGVLASFGGTGLGDIALVPAPGLKVPKGIRDVTEWYISTGLRQDYIHEVFNCQVDIALKNLERIFHVVGNIPDVVFICGTDFGTQTSQFCSTETFESLYAPYYRRINDWIHKNTTWKTFKHSCGAVEGFMSHFIRAGFDIINPVQCSASGMDPRVLKDKYGKELVFWGGGVDTQKTLPFDSVHAVKKEVRERLEIFSPRGGFVFNAIHNIQAKTPIDNIAAMAEAVSEFNSGQ
ncbi:MAG: methyltransferase [Spirochaetales bacterium]|nr:methyltransferase [Spirochaetales bacterium]